MNAIARYLRLLPAVVIVGTSLLVLKGVDLARAAQAPAQASGDPDNSGLAPSDAGGAPATRDLASDDSAAGSAGEVDVLSSLTRRRAELDARERALAMRENLLTAGEGRIDQKIGALKGLQIQIQALLNQRDDAQKIQIASLVKTYSAMKPKDAARIFNSLSDEVLLPVAKDMKSDVLAPVLAAMNPDAAQKLTVKLANLLKLPETKPAACPDLAAALPASPGDPALPGSAAAPAPSLQTAALSPPGSNLVVSPLPLPPAPPPAASPPTAPLPAPPPAQASTPPKPQPPPVHRPAATPPVRPATATTPLKPAAAAATPPTKPSLGALIPPAKPVTGVAPVTAPPVPPPTTPKPATAAANGPPTPVTPAPGG